ncbi:MAG: DUF805 domain-containing protein [Pseudomonadota bacterium]
MNLMNLLFSFQGRINRGKFWLAVLAYVILSIVLGLLFIIPVLGWIIGAIGYIAMIVSGIFVGIKRLHDRDKPGWWLVIFYVIPAFLSGGSAYSAYDAGEQTSVSMLLSLVGLALSLWGFVELGCLRGTVGPNKYGPDPIAPQPGH